MYFDFGMLVYVLIWENRIARADRSVLGNRTFTFSKTDFLILEKTNTDFQEREREKKRREREKREGRRLVEETIND